MRICIDLDGTICEHRQPGESYGDVLPKVGAKQMIDHLSKQGHVIIIHTARNMRSQDHNVGKVIKHVGKITLDWLDQHEIHYDEIFFGKPNADITIDDRSIRFENWSMITEEMLRQYAKEE